MALSGDLGCQYADIAGYVWTSYELERICTDVVVA
jgi:hypothetical protein